MAEEKMVPLDTSGNSVEVTLKEEDTQEELPVEESNIREIVEDEAPETQEASEEPPQEEEEEKEADPYKTDDLKDYSKGVKKRINNLVGRMREMERLYEATQKENEDLKKKYTNVGKGYVNEYEGRVTSAAEAAKANLKKAIEDNDTEGQVAAQEQLAQAKADAARLTTMKAAQQNDEKTYAPPTQQQQQQQQQYEAPAQIDTRAEEWASENEWFGSDDVMTGAAMALHNRLVTQEGFDPTSDEYYNEINSRMRTEFPQKFSNGKAPEEKKTETKQPVQTVASAVRKTKSGRRVVKLTPSQIAIAKRLNVPLEEYAKYVKE
jgi:hypothetical protein